MANTAATVTVEPVSGGAARGSYTHSSVTAGLVHHKSTVLTASFWPSFRRPRWSFAVATQRRRDRPVVYFDDAFSV